VGVIALSVIYELLIINCHDLPKSLHDGVRGFCPVALKKSTSNIPQ